jgi:hypothetical protein
LTTVASFSGAAAVVNGKGTTAEMERNGCGCGASLSDRNQFHVETRFAAGTTWGKYDFLVHGMNVEPGKKGIMQEFDAIQHGQSLPELLITSYTSTAWKTEGPGRYYPPGTPVVRR